MNFESWLDLEHVEVPNLAVSTWNLIRMNPVTLEFLSRTGSAIVNLAWDSSISPAVVAGPTGVAASRLVLILGVYNHPDPAVVDTDIRPGDRFVIDDVEYEVMDVVKTYGTIQARAQMRT